jgi:hypothetical protein
MAQGRRRIADRNRLSSPSSLHIVERSHSGASYQRAFAASKSMPMLR